MRTMRAVIALVAGALLTAQSAAPEALRIQPRFDGDVTIGSGAAQRTLHVTIQDVVVTDRGGTTIPLRGFALLQERAGKLQGSLDEKPVLLKEGDVLVVPAGAVLRLPPVRSTGLFTAIVSAPKAAQKP